MASLAGWLWLARIELNPALCRTQTEIFINNDASTGLTVQRDRSYNPFCAIVKKAQQQHP